MTVFRIENPRGGPHRDGGQLRAIGGNENLIMLGSPVASQEEERPAGASRLSSVF